MIGKLINRFFGITWKGYAQNIARSKTKSRTYFQKIALFVCFSTALLFAFSISYSAHADMLTAPSSHEMSRQILQYDSPISPLALAGQTIEGAGRETSTQANSAALIGVYHQTNESVLPLISGKKTNQTSLVLVGAVLMALMLVVGLAISRKEV